MTSNYFTHSHIHMVFQKANFPQEKAVINNTQNCYT